MPRVGLRIASNEQKSNGKEIWGLFDRGELHPAVVLTGRVAEETASADVDGLMQEIEAVRQEYLERMQYE